MREVEDRSRVPAARTVVSASRVMCADASPVQDEVRKRTGGVM
jgi:hypothetical protein